MPSSDTVSLDFSLSDPSPLKIERIYNEVYAPIRDRRIDLRTFEWTMYTLVVKGKDVQATVRKAGKGKDRLKLKGFTLKIGDAEPMDLNLWRLSACVLYDNCMNKSAEGTFDPPAGYHDAATGRFVGSADSLGAMAKYIPPMSTLIPWQDIASRLTNENTKRVLLDHVRFAFGAGLHFVWRIYQSQNKAHIEDAGPAFLIGAYYMDLVIVNAERRKNNKAPLTAADAHEEITLRDGTLSRLLTNCSDLGTFGNITSSPLKDIGKAIACPLTTLCSGEVSRES